MNCLVFRFPFVLRTHLVTSRQCFGYYLNNQYYSTVFLDENRVYRSSSSGFQLISNYRDRKSVLESPIILKVVRESESFIQSVLKEGIRPWNWFDVSLANRLLVYSESGVFPSEPNVQIVDLNSLQREFNAVKSSLGSDFLDLLNENLPLHHSSSSLIDSMRKRSVYVPGESSKSRIACALRPYPLYKKILSTKKSIILIADSPRNANELGEILSKSYPDVQWAKDAYNPKVSELQKLEDDLYNSGYILCPTKISNMVSRIIQNKTPIAVDFIFLDSTCTTYSNLPQRQKIALKMCVPGYSEFRLYLNESNMDRICELFENPDVTKVIQSVENRSAMIAGLRLLFSKQEGSTPLQGFFNINFALQVHHHLAHEEFLEIRNSGATKDYSFKESVKYFVLPDGFRQKGGLAQILALYFYFSGGHAMNLGMKKFIEERSSIEVEFGRDLQQAHQRKVDFFHKYCYRTIHVRDLRPQSSRNSMEEHISECFRELGIGIHSQLLHAPDGVLRLINQEQRFTHHPPFLDPKELHLAKQKYRLQISPIGPQNSKRRKEERRFIQHGEFLPRWTVHAKAMKRASLFHPIESSKIALTLKT